jgi:hypothetical protein
MHCKVTSSLHETGAHFPVSTSFQMFNKFGVNISKSNVKVKERKRETEGALD